VPYLPGNRTSGAVSCWTTSHRQSPALTKWVISSRKFFSGSALLRSDAGVEWLTVWLCRTATVALIAFCTQSLSQHTRATDGHKAASPTAAIEADKNRRNDLNVYASVTWSKQTENIEKHRWVVTKPAADRYSPNFRNFGVSVSASLLLPGRKFGRETAPFAGRHVIGASCHLCVARKRKFGPNVERLAQPWKARLNRWRTII